MTVAFLAVLLAANVTLRALPVRRRGEAALGAVRCAFLRGGTRAAVLAVLATVSVRLDSEPAGPFDQAVVDAGDPPTGSWGIARSRGVRHAAVALREDLVDEGLLAPTGHWAIARCALIAVPLVAVLAVLTQPLDLAAVLGAAFAVILAGGLWLAPRRTIAGWRALRVARLRYERVTLAEQGASTDAVGMLVALHGQPALDVLTQQALPPAQSDPATPDPATPDPATPDPATPDPAPGEPPKSSLTPRRIVL